MKCTMQTLGPEKSRSGVLHFTLTVHSVEPSLDLGRLPNRRPVFFL